MSRPLPVPSSSTEHLRSHQAQQSPSPSTTSSAYSRQQSLPSLAQPARPSTSLPTPASTPSQPRKLKGIRRLLCDWWLEFGAALIAIGAIAAIFATLAPHSGQPLPRWPYNLSINALISIYVVILKAAVLLIITQGFGQLKWVWFRQTRPLKDVEIYDDASRGSIRGALTLIWRFRGLQVIPCIGALVVAITIFSDPIAQQLVHYSQCERVLPRSLASVPRTNVYSVGEQSTHSGVGSATVPPQMQAAINAGIFSPDATPLRFDCPTGNCTIPGNFKTLGYCSQCSDVSNELKVNKTKNAMDQISLPSGLTAVPGYATFVMGYGLKGMKEPQFDIIDIWTSIRGSKPECAATNDNTSWSCRPYAAMRCHLYPCVKSYEVTDIVSGDLHERQLSNDADWPPKGGWGLQTRNNYISAVDMACIDNQQKQSLHEAGYDFSDSDQYIPYNASYDPVNYPGIPWASTSMNPQQPNSTMQIVPPQCIYQQSSIAESGLGSLFYTTFNGNVSKSAGGTASTSNVVEQFFLGGNDTYDTISDTFRNISKAMTKVIRTNGLEGRSAPVEGQVIRTETCVDVQWYWVIFPGSLVVLTLIFFIGVLIQTRPKDEMSEHNYKSSALALMFHGLEQRTVQRGLGAKGRASAMVKEAQGIYVKLGQSGTGTDRGWRFVEALPGARQKA